MRWPAVGEVLRYAKGADREVPELDGFANFHFVTRDPLVPSGKRILLESGINRVAAVPGPEGSRRPLLALRSSPWKAGAATNPWHDEFALDYGHVRYFGDHKPNTAGPVGATSGNRALLEAWELHASPIKSQRILAPPILLFRASPQFVDGVRIDKGFVEFCGVALIERLEHVVQKDPTSSRTFPNLVADLCVVDLSDLGDRVDFRWFDDRRNPQISDADCMNRAPASWVRWVNEGRAALPRVRRRVISSRVLSRSDQLPAAGSLQAETLEKVYKRFDDNKHAFESLAAKVAARVLGGSDSPYREGWITKSGGDGGLDFVGRLDVGHGVSNTPVVILGQAKCIQTTILDQSRPGCASRRSAETWLDRRFRHDRILLSASSDRDRGRSVSGCPDTWKDSGRTGSEHCSGVIQRRSRRVPSECLARARGARRAPATGGNTASLISEHRNPPSNRSSIRTTSGYDVSSARTAGNAARSASSQSTLPSSAADSQATWSCDSLGVGVPMKISAQKIRSESRSEIGQPPPDGMSSSPSMSVTSSSSWTSRTSAASADSPGSTLPPGNSHRPFNAAGRVRRDARTRRGSARESTMTAATTSGTRKH